MTLEICIATPDEKLLSLQMTCMEAALLRLLIGFPPGADLEYNCKLTDVMAVGDLYDNAWSSKMYIEQNLCSSLCIIYYFDSACLWQNLHLAVFCDLPGSL